MADNKKPTKKQLGELQDLFQSLESDVGISKVDEGLLQKFETGKLSKTEADKLRTDMKDALKTKVSPRPAGVSPEFRAEYPSSGAQFGSTSTDFQLKTPSPNAPAVRGPSSVELPLTKPEVVDSVPGAKVPPGLKPPIMDVEFTPNEKPTRLALPATKSAESKALVPVGERALQKLPGVTKSAANAIEKNPVLKKLFLPITLATGAGAAVVSTLGGEEERKDIVIKPTPPPTPTPTPPEVPSQPVTPVSAEPTVKKAPALNFDKYMQSMDQINKRYEQDRQISPELKAQFEQRQAGLEKALSDARSIYEKSVSKAESDADRREAAIQWASIAESLGQSMVKYFAAREGARTGQLLGSKIQFAKYDWAKDLDRNLDRLTKQTNQAKTLLGIAREDVETGMKTLGEERKTAMQEREAVAKQRAGLAEDVTKEQLRQEARSVSDYIEAQNRMALEGLRTQKAETVTAQREQAAEAKNEAAQQKVLQQNYGKLEGSLRSLAKKDTPQARKEIGAAAAVLGIPADEVDTLITETTGEGLFNLSEEGKVRGILDKYNPSQAAPAPAPAGGEQMVDMVSPQGKLLRVPASKVKELEAQGARRK